MAITKKYQKFEREKVALELCNTLYIAIRNIIN